MLWHPRKQKKEVIKIFENEIEEIMSDNGFTALLGALEPDQEIATEGNTRVVPLMISRWSSTTKNASLANVVKIAVRGEGLFKSPSIGTVL